MSLKRIRRIFKISLLPITIMVVPHAKMKPKKIEIPFCLLLFLFTFFLVGVLYTFSTATKSIEYRRMKRMVEYYKGEFESLNTKVKSLNDTQNELARLLALRSKKKIFETIEDSDTDSTDIQSIKREIDKAIESVWEIKKYLREEKDRYFSTPMGWPVRGKITSRFGSREHPLTKSDSFHSGIDISVPEGTPIRATASGIVVYSGWSYGKGNTVVIEHGHSFTTLYAHNKKNLVTVGQRVKRGDVIAISGSSGDTTGPHVHYEVWKNGRPVNPERYLAWEGNVYKE